MKYIAFIFIATFALLVECSVIGIDFGLDWFKVSIVKQGIPLDIVLNKESKRKTSTALTIHKNTRLYGGSTKHPEKTYHALKNLLGVHSQHPRALSYQNVYQNNMGQDKVITFNIEDQQYGVEHLVAMVLAHAKAQAEAHGKEIVTGAVLVVPPYFNQFERRAILDACDLASLRVIQFINDETAVALNYAMLRQFTNTTQHHVFYDMGAGSTVASLVSFRNVDVADGRRTKRFLSLQINLSAAQIQVLATGYEDTFGGTSIDQKTLDLLLPKFIKQHPSVAIDDLKKDSLAMSRLRREANRVKQVLSANSETYASAESLYNDLDFKALVKREELEAACRGEMKRVTSPIKRILETSGLKVSEIDSVVLVGGGVRMPMVQDALEQFVGKDKIARNVNGDEAAVLGAGFRAATISTLFRVREILVKDKNMEDVEVWYDVESKDRTIKTLIFTQSTPLGSKKLMSFKRISDFSFTLAYKSNGIPIMTASVRGVGAAFQNMTDTIGSAGMKFSKGPVVKAVLMVDESGMYSIGDVYLVGEIAGVKTGGDSISDSIKSFFVSKEASRDGGDKEAIIEADKVLDNTEVDNEEGKKEDSSAPKETAKADGKKKVASAALVEQVNLERDVTMETVIPLTDTEKQNIKARIHAMDSIDANVRAQEESLNTLESLIYAVKYGLEDDDVVSVSTESERAVLTVAFTAAQEWLEENYSAKTVDINKHHASLQSAWRDVAFRRIELSHRPAAVQKLTAFIASSRLLVSQTLANQTIMEKSQVKVYLEIPQREFGLVETSIDKVSEWLNGVVKSQEGVKKHDTAIFTSADCEIKQTELRKRVADFSKTKKWKYVVVEKESTSSKSGGGEKKSSAVADDDDESRTTGSDESKRTVGAEEAGSTPIVGDDGLVGDKVDTPVEEADAVVEEAVKDEL